MPSCGSCKSMLVTTTIWCNDCHSTAYCSPNCQKRHAFIHQLQCIPKKKKVIGWGPESSMMRVNDGPSRLPGGPPVVKHGFKKLPPNSIGGIGQDWTSDLPRNSTLYERAYQRFIDSYRLLHTEAAAVGKEDKTIAFVDYFKMAKKRHVLPAWWNAQCDKQLLAMAKGRATIPATQRSLVKARGPFEPMILHMMVEKIHGSPLQLRA